MPGKNLLTAAKKRYLDAMDTVYFAAGHPIFNGYWAKYGNPFDEYVFELAVFEAVCYKEPRDFKPVKPKRWGLRVPALEFQTYSNFDLTEVDWTEEYITEEENISDSGKIVMSKNSVVEAYRQSNIKNKNNLSLLPSNDEDSSDSCLTPPLPKSSDSSDHNGESGGSCDKSGEDIEEDSPQAEDCIDAFEGLEDIDHYIPTPLESEAVPDTVLASIPLKSNDASKASNR
jgi:hypothetical protein